MTSLLKLCGAAAIAMTAMGTAQATAEPHRGGTVHLTAASQSTIGHKPASTAKITTVRKKKRCF